jgi:hypothetical protein
VKTKWWILLIVVAFGGGLLTTCDRSGGLVSSGLSFLFNSKNKEVVRDTITIRDTIYIPYKVVIDTCLLMNKLRKLSKKEIRRLPKEIKLDIDNWRPILIDSFVPDSFLIKYLEGRIRIEDINPSVTDSVGEYPLGSMIYTDVQGSTKLDSLLPTPKVDLSKYYQERLFYDTPMNCDTPDRFNKMKRNSKHNLSAVMTLDAEGYYSGGLSYQTRSRWSFGFFVSSRKVNGLIVQIPIRRYE